MQISESTKSRLIRYAKAVQQYETRLSGTAIDEHIAAKNDLKHCREPEIQALVRQIQIERIDEVMADETKNATDVVQADHDAMIAKNELVGMGHEFIAARSGTKTQPSRRRKECRNIGPRRNWCV